MRILSVGNMYPPHSLGGYELMWQSGVRHLREAGHSVRVLTSDYRSDGEPGTAEDPDVHRELCWYWRDHDFPRIGLRERYRLERANAAVLQRHLSEFQPDAISWWAMGGMSLSLIERAKRARLPAVGFVHDDWMVYGPDVDAWLRACRRLGPLGPFVGRLAGVPARVDLGAAATWIFNSETMRRHALAAGWTLPRTGIAHPGINPSEFGSAPERPWGWRLLYLGRIDRRKGIATAINALTKLPLDTTLRIVGEGDDEHLKDLRALVAEAGLDERVSFDSVPRDRVREAYVEADAVLFPAHWEGWGLVPLEAMSVGRPVVATGAGGSGEYLRDDENCLLFEPWDDPAALAGRVIRLAESPELRQRLREAGFATASRFDQRDFEASVVAAMEEAATTTS